MFLTGMLASPAPLSLALGSPMKHSATNLARLLALASTVALAACDSTVKLPVSWASASS